MNASSSESVVQTHVNAQAVLTVPRKIVVIRNTHIHIILNMKVKEKQLRITV